MKLLKPILIGALLAGVLDLIYAYTHFYFILHREPLGIVQGIASGVLGAGASEGGSVQRRSALRWSSCSPPSWPRSTSAGAMDHRPAQVLVGAGALLRRLRDAGDVLVVLPLSAAHGNGYLPDGRIILANCAPRRMARSASARARARTTSCSGARSSRTDHGRPADRLGGAVSGRRSEPERGPDLCVSFCGIRAVVLKTGQRALKQDSNTKTRRMHEDTKGPVGNFGRRSVVPLPAHGELGVAIALRGRDDARGCRAAPIPLRRRRRLRRLRRPADRRRWRCICRLTRWRCRLRRRRRRGRALSPCAQDPTGSKPAWPPASCARPAASCAASNAESSAMERPNSTRARISSCGRDGWIPARIPVRRAFPSHAPWRRMSSAVRSAEISMRAVLIGPSRLIEPVSKSKRRPARSRLPRTSVAVPWTSGLEIVPWTWKSHRPFRIEAAAEHHDAARRVHLEVKLYRALERRFRNRHALILLVREIGAADDGQARDGAGCQAVRSRCGPGRR